jgi:hypothetical protein
MTIRISILDMVLYVETRRIRHRRVNFGRAAADPAVGAAALIGMGSVLIGIAQLAGAL